MIAMFDGACPSGWTQFSALDGKFPLGGTAYNSASQGAGNINSITTIGTNWTQGTGAENRSGYNTGNHIHTVQSPPYIVVVWCKKNL
jgi:hypothetical protein